MFETHAAAALAITAATVVVACLLPVDEPEENGLELSYGHFYEGQSEFDCADHTIDGVTIRFGEPTSSEACRRIRRAQSMFSLCARTTPSAVDIWAYADGKTTTIAAQGLDPVIDGCVRQTLALGLPRSDGLALSMHVEIEALPSTNRYPWNDGWAYLWTDGRRWPFSAR